MKVKRSELIEVAKLIKHFNINVHSSGILEESIKKIKLPKYVALYIENRNNIKKIKTVKSKQHDDTSYILEEIDGQFYISREIQLLSGEVSVSTLLLSNDDIKDIKDIRKPTVAELVSLGAGLDKTGAFGL